MPMFLCRNAAAHVALFVAACCGCQRSGEELSTQTKEEMTKLREEAEAYRKENTQLSNEIGERRLEANRAISDLRTANNARKQIEQERDKLYAECVEAKGKLASPYVHTVIYYLKPDAPTAEMTGAVHKTLGKLAGVRHYWIGKPAAKGTPDLADSKYALSMTMLFDDYAGLEEFLEADPQKAFADKYQKYIERVQVFDSQAIPPGK